MKDNTIYIIVGIMVFLIITIGIVIAAKRLSNPEDATSKLTWFHYDQNASVPKTTEAQSIT